MKNKNNTVIYADEPEDWKIDPNTKPLTAEEEKAAGIPSPTEMRAYIAKKTAKEERINIRLSSATLAGLKRQAEAVGMPYQTLAASALHLLATGKIKMSLIEAA